MNRFYEVPGDLWIKKSEMQHMQTLGISGTGYLNPPNKTDYVLVPKAAFQPVREDDIRNNNEAEVCFIWK